LNNYLIIFSAAFAVFVASVFFSQFAFADSPRLSGIIDVVKADPYYFSEGGFGIRVLKFYGIPLTPYLTPGTTEESTLTDILNSYNTANAKAGVRPIVDDKDRARYYVVHFWDTSNGSKTFTTFGKFQPIITKSPISPIGTTKYSTGFALESLTGKSNQWYYNNIINDYINPGKVLQPFSADIDVISGDGSLLETYKYKKCQLNEYVPFLSDNLVRLQFIKQFKSEVRDRADFTCDGFRVNFDLGKPSPDWASIQNTIDSIPDKKDTVQKYVVKISSDIFKSGQTYQTFAKFTPMGLQEDFPLSIATNPISVQTKGFSLESLPSKDKQLFYQYVIDKLNNKRHVQPVDFSIDLVNGDGSILQTWKYPRCDVTNYSTYRQEVSAIFKFTQVNKAEIRDKTFFSCTGLAVNFMPKMTILSKNMTAGLVIPSDGDRAQVFTVHFSNGYLEKPFDYTFLKFAPFSKTYSIFTLPDYKFSDKPQFYLESMPSKDKDQFYRLVNSYVNLGDKTPQPFDASVGLTSGDGSIMQTWKYTKCNISQYQPYFQIVVIVNTFTEKFQPEIRERTIFQCSGLSLDGYKSSANTNNTSIQAINFVPRDADRAQVFITKFSNGDFKTPQTYYTFADFQPDLSASNQVKTTYPQIKSSSFTLLSLPSKDKTEYYKFISRYANPTYKPEPFDASIETVSGDGTIIQTWKYQRCQLTDYKTYLQSSLLFYPITGKNGISETQDRSTFQCTGFSIAFGGGQEDLSKHQIIPSDEDRVMAYVTHLTSNELTSTRTNGLVQEFTTLGNQKFQIESLPNKYHRDGYYLMGKYINPNAKPELFDVNTELITGDGTKLYSIKYPKCYGTDYSIFLDDNIANIKFGTPIKSEFRDKAIIQCSGVNAIVLPKDQPTNIIGPIVQKAIGIPDNKIACNQGFQLLVRPPHEIIICVKSDHVSDLINRGWQKATTNHNLSNLIKPIIPTVDERAMSFRVTFQGTDIPTQTIGTFSKFVPISESSSTDPSYSLSGGSVTPRFYLESLPSKDKKSVYHLVSMYLNPGVKPELFDVKVNILNGDNSTLQTWSFTKCQITNYEPYLDENTFNYKFHMKWQSEIKDRATFSCSGLNLGLG